MIFSLILAAVFSVMAFGIISQFSGRVWAHLRFLCSIALTASLLACAVAIFTHPGWDTSQKIGQASGRGAVIVAIWQFFISIGNEPTAFIFAAMAIFSGRLSIQLLGDLRSGDSIGTEPMELEVKMVALAREIEVGKKQIKAGVGTYATREEAEAVAAQVNNLHKQVLAQQRELLALHSRREALRKKTR